MHLKKKYKNFLIFFSVLIIIVLGIFFWSKVDNSKFFHNDNNNYDTNKQEPTNKEEILPTNSVNLTLVGDFLFEQPYYDSITKGDDPSRYFQNMKSYFLDDDLSIGNMEVVIGNDNLRPSGTGFNFCAPEYIGDLMSTIDLEVLGTANNHSYDRGIEGVKSTLNYFKNKTDIMTVGTFLDEDDINKDRILEINGLKFGFLAYTYGTNQTPSVEDSKYINYFKNPFTKTITPEYSEKLTNEVTNLRNKVDVLIVLMHWGIEFTHTPNAEQKELAQKLNELGVDIVLGSHSHSIEPIEWLGDTHKTLVYYSLGNFVSADDDVSRAGEDFDNAYQAGLLSKLQITKNENGISINNVKTELIVNYYDQNMRNFELVPLKMYNENYEKTHYRYSYNFNRQFLENMYNQVIPAEFR